MKDLTKRGAFVLGVAVGLLFAVAFWLTGNLWWTEAGPCLGSMVECNL